MTPMRAPAPAERGFTLVEVLISLALASLILVATLAFVAAQGRAHRDSMELQTMQMGVRAALDRILRDSRSAAAGFSSGTVSVQDVTAANLDIVTLDAVSLGHTLGSNLSNTGTGGADELNLVFADGRGVTSSTKDAAGVINRQATAQAITVLDITGFTTTYPDNFVLVSNGGVDAILIGVRTITPTAGLPPTGTLTLDPMTTKPANVFPAGLASFPGGSLIMTASAVTYRIDATIFGSTEPALVMARGGPLGITGFVDPLASQVEDLQVALGYDGLNGGVLDGFITENPALGANRDEWAFNLTGDTLTGAITTLRAIRVSLVARSVQSRPSGADAITIEDHAPATTGVNYFRRRLRGVASVRNFAL
ncbi:MAG TPA: PilW family protein [Polyangia bacterium]|jgi:prepilin-type N-terminal cleavage/methylation domain-containing protein